MLWRCTGGEVERTAARFTREIESFSRGSAARREADEPDDDEVADGGACEGMAFDVLLGGGALGVGPLPLSSARGTSNASDGIDPSSAHSGMPLRQTSVLPVVRPARSDAKIS